MASATPKCQDHPLFQAGFIDEPTLRQLWIYSDSYWRTWLRENDVPYRVIGKERWFHRDDLVRWFTTTRPPNGDNDATDSEGEASENQP